MMILTAKVSKGKLAAALLLLLAAVVLVVVLLHHTGSAEAIAGSAQSSQAQTAPAKVKTNDDRVAFLESFGWKLEPQPLQEQDVRIPTDPSEVFERYNQLQISQGYDLGKFAGETVRRYVYKITNYPNAQGDYCAALLVLNETVIGGDVSSQSQGGVMQGFQMPGAADQTAELLPDAAASSAANTAAGSVSSAANMTPDSSVSATD